MQIALGGTIDAHTKQRLPLQEAIKRNWIDERKVDEK